MGLTPWDGILDVGRADRTHRRFSRSAWGDYQALGEIGAFYVDRALGWMRKPPTSGRRISSHLVGMLEIVGEGRGLMRGV